VGARRARAEILVVLRRGAPAGGGRRGAGYLVAGHAPPVGRDAHLRGAAARARRGPWIFRKRLSQLFFPRRRLADAAAADVPMASDDARRTALDFAPHQTRNALLFPPSYEGAAPPVARKAIQRANTRFGAPAEPRPRANTSSSYPDLSSVSSELSAGDEGLVPMTPRILPGGGASPLVTWGAVAATPRLLERDDRRQELGRTLDARAKRRRTAPPAPSPLRAALDRRASRPSASSRTPGRSPAPLRPGHRVM